MKRVPDRPVYPRYAVTLRVARGSVATRSMLKSRDSLTSTMKNPEHESGYFEDGSDVEINVEEVVITKEGKCVSGYYGLTRAIHELDVRDSIEPTADHYEDRLNRGTTPDFSWQIYLTMSRLLRGMYNCLFLADSEGLLEFLIVSECFRGEL